jgi:hypothetical protein
VVEAVEVAAVVKPRRPAASATPLVATVTYDNMTTATVTNTSSWTSSDATIAGVATAGMARGVVTGIKPGMVTITAQYVEGGVTVTGTAMLTVTGVPTGVLISPGNVTLEIMGTQNYTTQVSYSEGGPARTIPVTSTEMICVSSDPSIATIQVMGNNRQGRCLAAGSVTLTCTYTPAGTTTSVSGTTPLNCQDRVPTLVQVTPTAQTVPQGSPVPYTCNAIFGGTPENVTTNAETTWTTDNMAVATVNNTGMTKGQAQAVGQGTVTITCTFRGVSGTAMLTVGPVAPVGLTVTPASTTISGVNGTAQLEAFLQMSDPQMTQQVTNTVAWTTTGGAVDGGTPLLTVTNTGNMRGLVTVSRLPATNTVVTVTATYTGTGGTTFTADSRITVAAP